MDANDNTFTGVIYEIYLQQFKNKTILKSNIFRISFLLINISFL